MFSFLTLIILIDSDIKSYLNIYFSNIFHLWRLDRSLPIVYKQLANWFKMTFQKEKKEGKNMCISCLRGQTSKTISTKIKEKSKNKILILTRKSFVLVD